MWHNKDFNEKAKEIGISPDGSEAKMPESKSGRVILKYVCECRDNKSKLLILKTGWEIDAICRLCGKEYKEV